MKGATVSLIERISLDSNWSFQHTGRIKKNVVNVGSYNYLGFSENEGECAKKALWTVSRMPGGVGSARADIGSYQIHHELEKR